MLFRPGSTGTFFLSEIVRYRLISSGELCIVTGWEPARNNFVTYEAQELLIPFIDKIVR